MRNRSLDRAAAAKEAALDPLGELRRVEAHAVDARLDGNEALSVPANFRVDRFGLNRRAQPLVEPGRQLFAIQTQLNGRRSVFS